jgi:molybdenum cofactor biosynthesis enzyme
VPAAYLTKNSVCRMAYTYIQVRLLQETTGTLLKVQGSLLLVAQVAGVATVKEVRASESSLVALALGLWRGLC